MAIQVHGFGQPINPSELKAGDFFTAQIGEHSVLGLQTDFVVPGDDAPMICILLAQGGMHDHDKVPFLMFRSNIGEAVRRIDNPVSVRPHEDDLPFLAPIEHSHVRGSLAMGVDGSAFVRIGNGATGYVWLNLGDGGTAGSPNLPFYHRRWRLTVGPEDKPVTILQFG